MLSQEQGGRKPSALVSLPLSLPPAEQAPFQRQMHPIGRLPWRLLRALSCRAHLAQGGKALTAATPESSTSQAIGSSLKLILGTKRKQNLPKSPWGHRILPSSCTVRATRRPSRWPPPPSTLPGSDYLLTVSFMLLIAQPHLIGN